MSSPLRYARRCLIGLASLMTLNYAMLDNSAAQGSREEALRSLFHKRTLDLIKALGRSPQDALDLIFKKGSEPEAKAYYKRIATLIQFPKLDDPSSSLNDLLDYLGYRGLGAKNLEELPSYDLMPTTPADFQKLVAKINDPVFSTNAKLADFQKDRVLASRFFAPKIVNYSKPNTAPGSQNPFIAGWRKLVRMRPLTGSIADKGGIAEAYILFNFAEPLETKDPFQGNESKNNQVILVPKVSGSTKDSTFWIVYKSKSEGYKLGYALNVNFDLETGSTRDYFVPHACAYCHGHDLEKGDPVGNVYPYGKVNYLDTDQWYDMLDYDFPGTKQSPHDVVFDSKKAPQGSAEYAKAFAILRKLNEGALKQNTASKRPGPGKDFRIEAVDKWLKVHRTATAHVQPIFRAIDMGNGVVWSSTSADDEALLKTLNRYCFRCHSSIIWSVFDKSFVSRKKDLITFFVEESYMPQGRVISDTEKKALVDYLGKLK